jgi:hypothetical protein
MIRGTTLPPLNQRPPSKLGINCPDACSLHPSKIGWKNANALKATRERGAGVIVMARRGEELLGRSIANTSMSRHLKHYVVQTEAEHEEEVNPGPKPSDVDILDGIINAGFRNSKNWKPTIRDTLEAMKLKTQMTGNSAFDDLIKLFDVDDDDEEAAPESPQAVFSPEELPDESDEDLESVEDA